MPRRRTLSDEQLLAIVLGLIHAEGPDAATFAAVAKASGLSGSTLVQRFATKAAMLRAALLYAWDRLDAETERLAGLVAKTPEGAVALLLGLSQDYGDNAAAYGEGLLVLREDFRDPVLRARGAAWGKALTAAIASCFESAPAPETIARLMLSQWQGSLTWWGFGSEEPVSAYVETELRRFLAAVKI
ncbi:probable transcriptional regulator protein, TetR family [Rhizobium etli CFN 42]|uniref:Probable transcriptional regulator protein, TetR family n=1 Tax=Rhizobium etli (strain ATCC 51251 / DSM 11541 / JCM 21823 / NBRC 15573 / CFN 42) TaxID=347834 RepID=Q2KAR8_RHIEC|nr:TetR family transcriptional regulator [Rhizobium etli]ABC90068.1 probable transcriptional regulator protein, TetR family [Rhizobium etli CFN 42]